ncbi:MAG TPA: isocitrate dehydrogenase kinase/phosphatase AceK regulatory subunit, partial [Anaeromyxobacteraceae bacterium]|nr:isocitrate dehydrogenase kinase/phosphatase AceK regulatory subunit [Anaeromyxobacteraceae bacterium]
MLHESHVQLAVWGAASVSESYLAYRAEHGRIMRKARIRFEQRDWRGAHRDAVERLELMPRSIAHAVEELRGVLGAATSDALLREQMKFEYERALFGRPDPELARSYFNSVTRRLFGTVGVNPRAEFVEADVDPPPEPAGVPIYRTYPRRASSEELVAALLRDCAFSVPFRNMGEDARLAGALIDAHLSTTGKEAYHAIEVLEPIFFRGKGAYLIGRIRCGSAHSPFILPLLHGKDGICLDAVLLSPHDASIVFSFTRSYFHVDAERTGALISFLRTILPQKKMSELYISIGHNKHGKAVLYREIVEHLGRTSDRFEAARGDRGMVMIVFTLRSLDVVFKVIRDRFAPPKTIVRQDVVRKYALVFRHDRAGRLVDAQEFEDLVFERERFAPELLEELVREASETVRIDTDHVSIRHLYAERRVVPLNLFVRESNEDPARDALIDYGQAIRDL